MANSLRFRELRKRLRELRQRMLPSDFSPTGVYSDRELDRTRGYRLLVHAEIEAFIEDIARDAVLAKIAIWKNTRQPSELIVSFLAAYHAGFGASGEDDSTISLSSRTLVKERVDEAIELATTQYVRKLGENHGIRQDNLRRVLLPVGVEVDKLDQAWLIAIDEYGKKRGELAHKAVGTQQPIDPLTEYNDVKTLLAGLQELDAQVLKLAS